MKKIFLLASVALMAFLSAQSQEGMEGRMGCLRSVPLTRADDIYTMPTPYDFDPQKTYRQPVLLVAFSDLDFSMDNPAAYYNRLFNEPGFNQGGGPGCVADYLRDQSMGRVNLQFDIYGPVKVDDKAKSDKQSMQFGNSSMRKAVGLLCETETTDFSVYDWDGDGLVNQVLFVLAGYSGNQMKGYIWPNTGIFPVELPGGISCYFSSISCELWMDDKLCGIGTILHEFFHCLGLPDIYPMSPASSYSTADEGDLMDGGNYTGRGWCPPALNAMERMYLGWASPVELTEPARIEGMKPLSEGGETYLVRSTANSDEYYLLENRQQTGWDYGCPGQGLLIYHVDFSTESWRNNYVNVSDSHYRFDLFHADGKDYKTWDPANSGKDVSKWAMENWLRSRYLSTSPYPYTDPVTLVVNASLTDESSPSATLFTPAADGRKLMGKSITDIQMAADGSVSFDFMADQGTRITTPGFPDETAKWYTIDGRRLSGKPSRAGVYINNGKQVIIK